MKTCVIQQPPVFLNLDASMERAITLLGEAATQGANLVVFPEAWFPGYPTWVWRFKPGEDFGKSDDLFVRLCANAINLSKGGLTPLQEAAKDNGIVVVVGHHEIDGGGSTLFNSVAIIDADGTLRNNHRKTMPTNPERMVWGFGDASTLKVVDTAVGRIGALLCWENYMPLARYTLYAQHIEILASPTWDTGSGWLATMHHIARESGAWVIGCATPLEAKDIPEDVPHRDILFPDPDEWINVGDAVVHEPFGPAVAGPMNREKGMLFADIDIKLCQRVRRRFDVVGHYARPDLFQLSVNQLPQRPVLFSEE